MARKRLQAVDRSAGVADSLKCADVSAGDVLRHPGEWLDCLHCTLAQHTLDIKYFLCFLSSLPWLTIKTTLQWPSDDGNCVRFPTESACLVRRSIFNSHQSVCQWVQEAHAIPAGRSTIETCRWQNPSFDMETFLVVSFIVLSLSVPVYVVIAVVFTHVLLAPSPRDMAPSPRDMAPSPRDVEEQQAQRDTRRKSIAVRAQPITDPKRCG